MKEAEAIRAARMERVERVLAPICKKYGVTRDEVLGRGRATLIVRARHELMTDLWCEGLACAEIARILKRDHTTVMYAVQSVVGLETYRLASRRRAGGASSAA